MDNTGARCQRRKSSRTTTNSRPALGETLAWGVPESEAFPAGLKYSFQYLDPADEAILRYDNANDAHGVGRHHRHYRGTVEGVEFEGLRSHIERFPQEVETIHEREFA